MGVLSGLKPEKVFYYFEELCKIPHGSYHTKQISDYLVQFAKERNLECSQDDSNNVVIRKAASAGYEDAPVVILQGHCDMVCEKTADSTHDFEKDGLDLMIEGDYVTANGTTLGGDDGIAVAYALAILDDDTLKHPALEVVITTDEEVGLLGAKALDCSQLKGKYLINMDSEEEGYLWVSCAGGLSAITTIPVRYQEVSGEKYELVISGLNGGHSGAEIDKNRANANKLLGTFLYSLRKTTDYELISVQGGQKDNAITREAEAKLLTMIDELNLAMKEQFTKEFGSIQQMFTTVFQDLFEGGTASLELMDTENILECGIRIIAQPPGKKLQNIMLLSGGERALTAIALLFAIQNLKPSPFCLLDEIEAALDDANIVRFSKYLKKLSKDTQFIVITHRRGTMAAADRLYGITMQEKGVSTLVSVNLIENDLTQ